MRGLHVEGSALVASLVSMLLVSWGTSADGPWAVAVLGGVLLAASLAALTVLRFVDLEEAT